MTVFLKHNNFQDWIVNLIRSLRLDYESYDVSLIAGCENSGVLQGEDRSCDEEKDRIIGAHKLILMNSSGKFRRILTQMSNHPKPCIYLHGLTKRRICSLLDFMYLGQIEMRTQKDLKEFMEVAKEFEISGNVCFGKPKHPIQKNRCAAEPNKTSTTKRSCEFEPSFEEIIKVPRLQKNVNNELEGKKDVSKRNKRPAFKIKIRPFSMGAKNISNGSRRCTKAMNESHLVNDKGIHFLVCPITKCGRIFNRHHNLKIHFESNHSEKSWAIWNSKCKKYLKSDFARRENAIYEYDEALKMYLLRKSCKLINFHDRFNKNVTKKIERKNSPKAVGYDEFYPCPMLECGIIMMKTSRRRHFQRRHPTQKWDDWSNKWKPYDLADYKNGPSALFILDDQSNRYELKKQKRFCNFHTQKSIENVMKDVQELESRYDSTTEQGIGKVLKDTVLCIPQISNIAKDSEISYTVEKQENLKRIFDNAKQSEDLFS